MNSYEHALLQKCYHAEFWRSWSNGSSVGLRREIRWKNVPPFKVNETDTNRSDSLPFY